MTLPQPAPRDFEAEMAAASLVSGARLATISAASKPSIQSCAGPPHVVVQR